MSLYDYWIDGNLDIHDIYTMDSEYITNCLNALDNCLRIWRNIVPEQLSREDMLHIGQPLSKAWFVFNGIEYIDMLCGELERRKEIENE